MGGIAYFTFLNGEDFTDLGNQVLLLYANANAGTNWWPSGSAAQAAALKSNNRAINPVDLLQNENTPAVLNLNKRIGNSSLRFSLSGRGRDKGASLGGNFKVGKVDAFVDYVLGDVLVAGFYQNIVGNDLRILYNSGTKQAQFQGRIKPIKDTTIDVYVNNLFDLNRNIRLGASYNGRYFGAAIDIDNMTNPQNVVLRGNVNVEDLSAYVQYWYNNVGFNKKLVTMTYDFVKVKLITDLSVLNDKNIDYNLSLLANNISFSFGRGIDKKAKVAVSFYYSF